MDYTIRDSSVWEDNESTSLLYEKDCAVRLGVIREEIYISDYAETRYVVEVWDSGNTVPVTCVRTSRFGGVYNYEEYTLRDFQVGESTASSAHAVQPGDHVIVAYANGDSREGFILGFLNHSGRSEAINHPNNETPNESTEFANREGHSVVYASEFNGLEQAINKAGEYRVTFKGLQTNIDKLSEPPTGEAIVAPEYDAAVGSSYFEFDKTGSYNLTDNAEEDLQSIFIDKPNGKIVITSGKTILTIDKAEESYSITNKKTTFDSTDEFNVNTKKTVIKSSELIEVEAADIKTKGKWAQEGNMAVKGNTEQTGNIDVTGNFSTTGATNLAGGGNALVYDIILTIGTGNLGAPVISSHTFLKTVQTKAS